jgi:hypothetical protein
MDGEKDSKKTMQRPAADNIITSLIYTVEMARVKLMSEKPSEGNGYWEGKFPHLPSSPLLTNLKKLLVLASPNRTNMCWTPSRKPHIPEWQASPRSGRKTTPLHKRSPRSPR